MPGIRIGAAALAVCCSFATPAAADEIELLTGAVTEGVIVEETDSLVRVHTRLGVTGIGREFIADIRRATAEENAALRARWRREEAEETAARAARRAEKDAEAAAARAYADAQRAKGLMLFDDEWVPQAEADLRLQRERQQLEAANNQRVRALEAEVRETAARAAAQVAALEADREQLNQLLAERDAAIATLQNELHHCEVELYDIHRTYTHAIHGLQAQLARCRATCSAAP